MPETNGKTEAVDAVEDDILAEIEAFLVKHSMSPTAFGAWMVNSGQLVFAMRLGRKLRPSTVKVLRERMAAYDDVQEVIDSNAVDHIRSTGPVMVTSNGKAYFATSMPLEDSIFHRLVNGGKLEPAGDSMFGTISQTFRAKNE